MLIRRTRLMAAGKNFAFKIAAKPLQIETYFLLSAYITFKTKDKKVKRRYNKDKQQ